MDKNPFTNLRPTPTTSRYTLHRTEPNSKSGLICQAEYQERSYGVLHVLFNVHPGIGATEVPRSPGAKRVYDMLVSFVKEMANVFLSMTSSTTTRLAK